MKVTFLHANIFFGLFVLYATYAIYNDHWYLFTDEDEYKLIQELNGLKDFSRDDGGSIGDSIGYTFYDGFMRQYWAVFVLFTVVFGWVGYQLAPRRLHIPALQTTYDNLKEIAWILLELIRHLLIKDGVKRIPDDVIMGRWIQPFTIPGTVETVGRSFLMNLSVDWAPEFPPSVTKIGLELMKKSSTTKTPKFLGPLKKIDEDFLYGCRNMKRSPVLPKTVIEIRRGFMSYCASVKIPPAMPPKLEYIGNHFMGGCRSLTRPPVFPKTLVSVGASFMEGCTSMKTPPKLPRGVTIGDSFLSSTGIETPPDLPLNPSQTSLYGYFLYSCTNLRSPPIIPDTIEVFSGQFMKDCTSLEKPPVLPKGLKRFGREFMFGCTSLTEPVVLPEGIQVIQSDFMARCENLILPPMIPKSVISMQARFVDGYDFDTAFKIIRNGYDTPNTGFYPMDVRKDSDYRIGDSIVRFRIAIALVHEFYQRAKLVIENLDLPTELRVKILADSADIFYDETQKEFTTTTESLPVAEMYTWLQFMRLVRPAVKRPRATNAQVRAVMDQFQGHYDALTNAGVPFKSEAHVITHVAAWKSETPHNMHSSMRSFVDYVKNK